MAQPESIEDAIGQNAKVPKSRLPNQSVEQQPIDEQIKADQYPAAKNAAAKPQLGLQFTKIPPCAG